MSTPDLREIERQLTQRRLDIEKLQRQVDELKRAKTTTTDSITTVIQTPGNDDALSGGSIVHKLVHIFQAAINMFALTASRPLKLDADKNIISEQINLASTDEVSGILGPSNGGTGGGATGPIILSSHAVMIQYKDWSGANASAFVLDGVGLTPNDFTNGVRTT